MNKYADDSKRTENSSFFKKENWFLQAFFSLFKATTTIWRKKLRIQYCTDFQQEFSKISYPFRKRISFKNADIFLNVRTRLGIWDMGSLISYCCSGGIWATTRHRHGLESWQVMLWSGPIGECGGGRCKLTILWPRRSCCTRERHLLDPEPAPDKALPAPSPQSPAHVRFPQMPTSRNFWKSPLHKEMNSPPIKDDQVGNQQNF